MNITKLTHYSNTEGIAILLPQAGSTRPDGNGAEKKRAGLPGFVPRWYGYVDEQTPEYRIEGRRFKYEARVSTYRLYDIDVDSDGYRDNSRWSEPNALEFALEEAGYIGYFSAGYGIAAIFHPVPCIQVTHERDLFEFEATI
jgi:hypothetical protein